MSLSLYSIREVLSPAILVLLLATYWLSWIIYTRFFHPLRHIPGPFLASISRLWIANQILRGDTDFEQRRLHAKHGPLIRVAPNEVGCSDPESIRTIYSIKNAWTKTGGYIGQSNPMITNIEDFYPLWDNKAVSENPDLFSNTDEVSHSKRRRTVNHVYSLSNVLKSEQYIDLCSALFIKRMGEYADSNTVVDLGEWLQMYAFDVIGELFFSRMFGFMENRHDYANYIASLDTLMPPMVIASVSPTYARPFILGSTILIPAARKALGAVNHIAKAACDCVGRRSKDLEAGVEPRRDLLAQLFEILQEKGEKVDFKIDDIQKEAYVALFAGSDTTAIEMRAVFYYLMTNPDKYEKLMSELDAAAERGALSSPVKYAEAIKLPYLCATIKEAMRLHPSVGLSLPRIVPAGGVTIAGQHIPAGYRVGVNASVVHYDKEIFGEDADQFNPSRWLGNNAVVMDKYMFQFGAGTRTCIGKHISLSELHKLIPQVLRYFKLELADPNKKWKTSVRWFNKQTGLKVRLTRR